ncbi:MAG: ABC transporter ATP-binding protein [Actinobacteria bacterium]|nr:ABC transporter ATP-binding protein [Thermoleophilia bacterium]MCB9011240.1 ABC transporter ATP-binding protein [Actinomycetota bacterium]
MLEVSHLRKRFGEMVAVDDVSFTIDAGETFGLLGPNGAGKTTTISMICGLLEPDNGSVVVNGEPISVGRRSGRRHIGYVPQELAIYPDLSGRDNLRFFGRLYGLRGAAARSRIDEVLHVVGLSERGDDRAREYSGGMQRRLNIAAGMLHNPSLLILDEPTVGIDPQSRNAILEAVAALGRQGMSVLYTTHYMEEAERLCQRVAIMDHGQVRAVGTRRELIALVGEHDAVTVMVVSGAERAARALDTESGVVRASAADGQCIDCVVDDAAVMLPRLVTRLTDAGLAVQNVQVREPSLDAVFLHITGTGLRD